MSDRSHRTSCPTCADPLERARPISVCGACHDRLLARGDIPLTSTAEFAAMTPATAEQLLAADPDTQPGSPARVGGGASCTWCGKAGSEVKKLLSSGPAHICNECVGLCAEILAAELGDDWR
jgi:hypothetical protein